MLAARDYKADLQEASLKKSGYNIDKLHDYIASKIQSIKNSGSDVSAEDEMLVLFKAYKSFDNERWNTHVQMLESTWVTDNTMTPQRLREQAKGFQVVMSRNKEWRAKTAAAPDKVALAAEGSSSNNKETVEQFKARHSKWKFDRSKSSSTT